MFKEIYTMLSRPYKVDGYIVPTVVNAQMNFYTGFVEGRTIGGDQKRKWSKRFFTQWGWTGFLKEE